MRSALFACGITTLLCGVWPVSAAAGAQATVGDPCALLSGLPQPVKFHSPSPEPPANRRERWTKSGMARYGVIKQCAGFFWPGRALWEREEEMSRYPGHFGTMGVLEYRSTDVAREEFHRMTRADAALPNARVRRHAQFGEEAAEDDFAAEADKALISPRVGFISFVCGPYIVTGHGSPNPVPAAYDLEVLRGLVKTIDAKLKATGTCKSRPIGNQPTVADQLKVADQVATASQVAPGAAVLVTPQPTSCFATDPGAASTDRAAHLSWGQANRAVMTDNLLDKIDEVGQCLGGSLNRWADTFASASVVIARAVPDPMCFGGDAGVVSPSLSDHRAAFATAGNRGQVLLDNLLWKTSSAMRCLAPGPQAELFADLSVELARSIVR